MQLFLGAACVHYFQIILQSQITPIFLKLFHKQCAKAYNYKYSYIIITLWLSHLYFMYNILASFLGSLWLLNLAR